MELIKQGSVGFLQHHFVPPHARSFDGVLAEVIKVYSITSDSPIKRKKCQHNMGCCLAALISKLPTPAVNTTSSDGSSTSSFLVRIARQDDDDEEETKLLQEMDEAIITYDDPPNTCSVAAPLQQTTNVVSSTPPHAVRRAQQCSNTGRKIAMKVLRKEAKVDDLTFTRREQVNRKRAPEKDMNKHDRKTIK
jgi:hypothetical protein